MPTTRTGEEGRGSDLTRLIDLEDRIAREAEEARAHGETLLAEARRRVEREGEREAGRRESEVETIRRRSESECLRAIEAIEAEARRMTERIERAGRERLGVLADRLIERLLETLPGTRGTSVAGGRDRDHQDVPGAGPGRPDEPR